VPSGSAKRLIFPYSADIELLLEYFPRLEEIADKVLFGTDWPGFGVRDVGENIAKFKALPLSEAAQHKILYDNAARLFPPSK